MDIKSETLYILYDGECPFCSQYVKILHIKQKVAEVSLINARTLDQDWQNLIKEKQFDLDEGMLAVYQGEFYHGAKAMNLFAKLAEPDNFSNKFLRLTFKNATFSDYLYPILRFFRNMALKIKGVKPINKS